MEAASIFTTAVTEVMNVVPTIISTITSNTVLATYFAIGIVGIAVGTVRKLKHV